MNSTRLSGRDLAAALAVVVIWGSNFVAMKFALRDFTPFQLGAARYVFAVLPLVFFIKSPKLHWKWVLMYGLFQGVGQFGFLFSALKVGMTAALASVLMQTQAFFTALFGFVLLRERLSRQLVIAPGQIEGLPVRPPHVRAQRRADDHARRAARRGSARRRRTRRTRDRWRLPRPPQGVPHRSRR